MHLILNRYTVMGRKRKIENTSEKDISNKVNKGGRPTIVLTPEQIVEVGEMAQGMTADQIADNLGISRDTFFQILNRQPEVNIFYKRGKAALIRETAGELVKKIRQGDLSAIIFFLKTQAGWREKQDINLVNEDGSLKAPGTILVEYVSAKDKKKED
jgi:hypothetical protein